MATSAPAAATAAAISAPIRFAPVRRTTREVRSMETSRGLRPRGVPDALSRGGSNTPLRSRGLAHARWRGDVLKSLVPAQPCAAGGPRSGSAPAPAVDGPVAGARKRQAHQRAREHDRDLDAVSPLGIDHPVREEA